MTIKRHYKRMTQLSLNLQYKMGENVCEIELPNGSKMPILGLGTMGAQGVEVKNAVKTALNTGYRLIDTAYLHCNEEEIGSVIREFLESRRVKRNELFIISKLPFTGMRADKVEHFCSLSLKNLSLSYVDMYMLQAPVGIRYKNDDELLGKTPDGNIAIDCGTNLVEIWKAMENLVEKGFTKHIGICHFNQKQIEKLLEKANIPPANLQIEVHPYFQQRNLRMFCKSKNISVTAICPLGSLGRDPMFFNTNENIKRLLDDPVLKEMAESCNKTPAQVVLRHMIQKGICVIPKSVNSERIKENFDVFDFFLIPNEMRKLDKLDKGKYARTFDFSFLGMGFLFHPEYPFEVDPDDQPAAH